jgi:hypothetical protein
LIYGDEAGRAAMSEQERDAEMGLWFKYTEDMRQAGVMLAGDALQFASMATTVRVRDGKTVTTDGPFAETKEVLGGFYILEVANVDDAIRWAEKCPGAVYGSIELRPLMEYLAPVE